MQDEIQREQTVQTWREEVLSRSSVSIFVSTGIYFFEKLHENYRICNSKMEK